MLERISLSIVIPIYNSGFYLKECLDSILSYSGKLVYEVVLVDDGSDDNQTISIIEEYKHKIDNVQIVRQANQGAAAARNAGCSIVRSDIVFFVDSDNIIFPNKCIDKAVSLLNTRPDISIVYGERLFFKDGSDKVRRYYQNDFSIEELCHHSMIDMCAFIRKEVWVQCNGLDTTFRFCQDWDFWLTAYEKNFNFHHVSDVWFKYRTGVPNSVGALANNQEVNRQTMSYLYAKHHELFYRVYRASFRKVNKFRILRNLKMKWRMRIGH